LTTSRRSCAPPCRSSGRLPAPARACSWSTTPPDGTGPIADRLAAELDEVEVLHRPAKEGIGRAYLACFESALRSDAELVLEMNSDFSHDPADLPRLIAAAGDADLVLGSRYVAGGGVVNWGLSRRLLSRGGSCYARTLLGVPSGTSQGASSAFAARCSSTSTSPTLTRMATGSRSS
jgi:dolichol-phosphate mannosyltransferase